MDKQLFYQGVDGWRYMGNTTLKAYWKPPHIVLCGYDDQEIKSFLTSVDQEEIELYANGYDMGYYHAKKEQFEQINRINAMVRAFIEQKG